MIKLILPITLFLLAGCQTNSMDLLPAPEVLSQTTSEVEVAEEPRKLDVVHPDQFLGTTAPAGLDARPFQEELSNIATAESKRIVQERIAEEKRLAEEQRIKEEKVEVAKEEKGVSTSSEEKNNNKQAEPKAEPKSYTESEIIKLVLSGDFGNGSERKRNVEKHGFNYNEIQAKINKDHAPKPKEEPKPSSGSSSTTQYAPNRIYIKGSSMPIRNEPSIANLQETVDNVGYTWISYGQYSPNDNSGTWFGAHRNLGGSVLLNVQVGENIIVTDSNGNPHTYRVNHRYIENKAEVFDDELAGRLPREYIVVQTSEPRVNGKRNGNRHVIAYKVN